MMIYNFENISFQILSVSTVVHRDGFFEVAGRPYDALSFKLGGHAVFDIDGKRIVNDRGDMIFIPANMPYKVDYSSASSIVVHLVNCNYGEAEKITTEQKELMETRFFRMINSWQEKHSANKIKSYVYGIFDLLDEEATISAVDQELLRCIKYIEDNYTDPDLSVEGICKYTHVSHSSLQRRFHSCFGIPVTQYIQRLRMNKALDMLSEGKASVKETAFACGFADEKYFSRVFKKTFGYSPAQFVKKIFI
ncbi:MAG: helix-turn-helix domain-containing protein [Clostridia bacterium]|nr:helix-turn-helix domain-containing protein [Clostridia bacterium]